MARACATLALAFGLLAPPVSLAEPVTAPPIINCAHGFEGLRKEIEAREGTLWTSMDGSDMALIEVPDRWRAFIAFTAAGHPAHPAVTMRTLRKQVTGVWTADSKGCGYGNPDRFSDLMADMKATDTKLTEASRAEVERAKEGQSPLAAP